MIHSLTIKKYLSFKDEVTFSFEATNDKKLEDYLVFFSKRATQCVVFNLLPNIRRI
jgi:hypothetical protein